MKAQYINKLSYLLIRASRILILFYVGLISFQSYSQCTPSFVIVNNGNGVYTFSNTSTITNSTTTYSWLFPGGSPSSSSNSTSVNVTYTSNSVFTASLSATVSSPSCFASWGTTFTVTGACTLTAGYTYTLGANGQATFASTSSGASGYTWVPGNFTGSTFTTTFPSNGNYLVTLFVSSGTCPVDSTSQLIPINSICTLSANASANVLPGGYVQFQNNTTGTASPTTYTWSFGDGNSSTSWAPGHQYLTNGPYIATLTVVNNSMTGCSSTYTMLINVNTVICNANFTYSVLPNGTVNFSSTSQPATITSVYNWYFSGGTYSSIGNPTATMSYSANGIYSVTLGFASGTCTTSVTYTINVNSIIPCQLNANFSYSIGPNGHVNFTNLTTGTTSATSYTWDFGDNSGSGASAPAHTYSNNGYYYVTLFASNGTTGNCQSDTTIPVYVLTYTCSLQASLAHTVGTNGYVTYSSTSTGLQGGEVYNWQFGDGYSGTGQVVNHTYQNGGTHYVSLAITNPSNLTCHDTIVQAVNITGISCTADAGFTLVPTSTPQYWSAIPVYPWNIVSASWSWGDGSQSDSLYVSHTYSASGQYYICLTVTASCGSTATTCATYSVYRTSGSMVHVNVEPPLKVGLSESAGAESPGIHFYPVPASEALTIQLTGSATKISTVVITDFLGKNLYENRVEGVSKFNVDVSQLPSGIYLLHVTNGSWRGIEKFVVEK